jgi:Co/Zn/Cd efflux system component
MGSIFLYSSQNRNEITHAQQHKVIALSGFASAVIMLLITLGMIYESATGFFDTHANVDNETLLVAVIAVIVNGISAFFLHREEEKSGCESYRRLTLHVFSDVVLSVFAIIALTGHQIFSAGQIAGLHVLALASVPW